MTQQQKPCLIALSLTQQIYLHRCLVDNATLQFETTLELKAHYYKQFVLMSDYFIF